MIIKTKHKRKWINCKCCGKAIYELYPLHIANGKYFCSAKCVMQYHTIDDYEETMFIPEAMKEEDRGLIKSDEMTINMGWLYND